MKRHTVAMTLSFLLALVALQSIVHANLLQNPGFEQWDDTDDAAVWTEIRGIGFQSYTQYEFAPFGDYCVEITIWHSGWPSGVWQQIEVGPAVVLSASAWVKSPAPSPLYPPPPCPRVGIDPRGNTNITSPDIVWSDPAASGSWEQLSVETTSLASYVTVFIGSQWVEPRAGQYFIDNASLIPEPATVALLAFGTLFLLRKRRP